MVEHGTGEGPNPQGTDRAAILDQLTEGVVVADSNGWITFVNEAAARLGAAERPGARVAAPADGHEILTVDGESYVPERHPLARVLREGEPIPEVAWRVRRADGTEVRLRGSATPLFDDGRRSGAVLVFRDATEKEQLREQLEIEQTRLREVFLRAPAFIAVLRGPEHVFELANPPYYQLVGHRELIGRSVRDALPEVAGQGYFEVLDGVYETGETYVGREMPIMLQYEEGGPLEERYLTFVYQPFVEADGSVSGILAHGMDVTEEVQARQKLEELYRDVERANRAKSDFLAVMSHELRTPLTAIIGYTDLLETEVAGPVTEEQRRKLQRIDASSTHLLELIEEILEYVSVESNRETLRSEPTRIEPLVQDALAVIGPLVREKGLELRVDLPETSTTVSLDGAKVRRILVNLLSNAVKFTERGTVAVEAIEEARDLVFRVSDTGIGIRPDDQDAIFEPFWQAEEAMTRSKGGTGLGLTLARRLARLLGGDLTVESELGAGSTFTLRIPAFGDDRTGDASP